ncbi:hypothetical protein MUO66_00080 [Candidatus Bathyarchaeota archaeon]|nr:hypothetical protein [Candidatus Bathyarchaeota archaeon]
MSNDLAGLIRINKFNAKHAVEVLVSTFRNYPLLQYYFPSEVEKEKISNYFLSFVVLDEQAKLLSLIVFVMC